MNLYARLLDQLETPHTPFCSALARSSVLKTPSNSSTYCIQARVVGFALLSFLTINTGVWAADTVEDYIAQYPNQQQAKMMNAWLAKHQKGTFSFSGLVDPTDTTVVTPQATVDYGYNWFSVSVGPAIVTTPQYDKFFSISVFDMITNLKASMAVIQYKRFGLFLRRKNLMRMLEKCFAS